MRKQAAVNPFLRQRFFNRASQASWGAFAGHREQVTARLGEGGGALCVLGAGNCNDLDLVTLTQRWERVRLVDIDAEAMQAGVAQQFQMAGGRGESRIALAPCDLTGALECAHEIIQSPSREAFSRLRVALGRLPAVEHLGEPFACVASTCLLSQLILIFVRAVGEESPELQSIVELVRMQHLRTLAELTAPGGEAVLFADFVSSETYPELVDAPVAAMDRVVREQGYFPGMNPLRLRRLLEEGPLAGYWEGRVRVSDPWVWNLGPRSYLVVEIRCRRKGILGDVCEPLVIR